MSYPNSLYINSEMFGCEIASGRARVVRKVMVEGR